MAIWDDDDIRQWPEPDLRYLSLGAGVQSSALYVLCTIADYPRPHVAIFADTQDEPAYVYTQLECLKTWGKVHNGPPIITVTEGCISADTVDRHKGLRTRFTAIPAFTPGLDGRSTMLRRQCTQEYKIRPIERKVRELLGFRKGQRVAGYRLAEALIGISLDEATRMKPNRTSWIVNRWPLIENRLRRSDCIDVIKDAGLQEPKKSACRFCPFHDDSYWRMQKLEQPVEFEKSCQFDESIRDMSKSGIKGKVYLHRSLIPLRKVNFSGGSGSVDTGFDNECEGHCGV